MPTIAIVNAMVDSTNAALNDDGVISGAVRRIGSSHWSSRLMCSCSNGRSTAAPTIARPASTNSGISIVIGDSCGWGVVASAWSSASA